MKLHELRPVAGSKSAPKGVGRGTGSGLGRNVGKGGEGQNARSGDGVRPGFEGGQMPLYRRLPRKGFISPFTKHFVAINVDRLSIFGNGAEVTPELLLERRIVSKLMDGVEILGNGDIEKSLIITDCRLSKQAAGKIVAAGGRVEVK